MLLWGIGAALAQPGLRGPEVVAEPPPTLDAAYAPRRVALVIGVDDYTDEQLTDLRYAGKDADAMAALLADGQLGGFDAVYTVGESLSVDGFWRAFQRASEGLQRDDTFLLYYSGHGTMELETTPTSYLLLSDSALAAPVESGVSLPSLEGALSDLPALRLLLVVDAFHS